jgi:hypothetical protein
MTTAMLYLPVAAFMVSRPVPELVSGANSRAATPPVAVDPAHGADGDVDLQRRVRVVTNSGTASLPWHRRITELLRSWPLRSPSKVRPRVTFSPASCYAAGCIFTTLYADERAVSIADRWFTMQPTFFGWPGHRFRSPPLAGPGGKIKVVWIVSAPSD